MAEQHHRSKVRKLLPLVRLLLLFAGFLVPTGLSYQRTAEIRDHYQAPGEDAPCAYERVVPEMTRQNELLFNWAAILLGGCVALVTTTKCHPVPGTEWVYLLLAPGAAFLFGSVWAGIAFQRRLTYLLLRPITTIQDLCAHLDSQADFFQYAAICLLIFGGYFFLNIVWGKIKPIEKVDAI